jgi:hypothetical protein
LLCFLLFDDTDSQKNEHKNKEHIVYSFSSAFAYKSAPTANTRSPLRSNRQTHTLSHLGCSLLLLFSSRFGSLVTSGLGSLGIALHAQNHVSTANVYTRGAAITLAAPLAGAAAAGFAAAAAAADLAATFLAATASDLAFSASYKSRLKIAATPSKVATFFFCSAAFLAAAASGFLASCSCHHRGTELKTSGTEQQKQNSRAANSPFASRRASAV